MTDQDKAQAIAQRNQAMNPNMTLACPAYLHGFVPVQDENVKAPEKTTYTQLTTRRNDDRPRQEPSAGHAERSHCTA